MKRKTAGIVRGPPSVRVTRKAALLRGEFTLRATVNMVRDMATPRKHATAVKQYGIAAAAHAVPCAEGALRRLDRKGVTRSERDQWGRRLFGDDDIEAARAHFAQRGSGVCGRTG